MYNLSFSGTLAKIPGQICRACIERKTRHQRCKSSRSHCLHVSESLFMHQTASESPIHFLHRRSIFWRQIDLLTLCDWQIHLHRAELCAVSSDGPQEQTAGKMYVQLRSQERGWHVAPEMTLRPACKHSMKDNISPAQKSRKSSECTHEYTHTSTMSTKKGIRPKT